MIRTRQKFGTSNILGATSLSRGALAELFRNNGLFGRDSNQMTAEQAILQSRLPSIQSLRLAAILPKENPRLNALSALADALIAADESAIPEKFVTARTAGLSEQAISEIAGVIGNVRAVFGLGPKNDAPPFSVPRSPLSKAA